jgi:hypothetical protein
LDAAGEETIGSMELSQLRLRKLAGGGGSWSGGPQFMDPLAGIA